VQNRVGEIVPAYRSPSGELVPDLRRPVYEPPDWAVDPFIAAGVADELPTPSPLVGGRYLVVAALHRSARGAVYLAVDLKQPRRCILKQAPAGAQVGAPWHEPHDRLRHEAQVLRYLQPDCRFPS